MRNSGATMTLWGDVERSAIFSEDKVYRYVLERRWGPGDMVLFMMLNPSTADETQDDNTIRRCISFAKTWGYGGLFIWNLYAYRSTDQSVLDRVAEPIGRENEDWLWKLIPQSRLLVAAWGANPNRGSYKEREFVMLVGPLYDHDVYCVGITEKGHPRHPLYIEGKPDPILYLAKGEMPVSARARGES